MILAGDVGGTKTILALWTDPQQRDPEAIEIYPSRKHAAFEEIVRLFLDKHRPEVRAACFGIAGPIRDGKCTATNLPWTIDSAVLRPLLGKAATLLINDLEANAYGLTLLRPEDMVELQPGERGAAGNQAIISAGTGLGEAGLYFDGKRHRPWAAEGGHTDFSPRNEVEIELLRFLAREFTEHVSWERVVSGPGLLNVYRFLRDTGRGAESPGVAARMASGDPSAVISAEGLRGGDALSVAALSLFISLYGSEAGNLALKTMARGGLYIGGGVAPKNMAKMTDGTFLEGFLAKGRMRGLLQSMPVRIILNDKLALLGAGACARELPGAS